jgi:hypothetical protein
LRQYDIAVNKAYGTLAAALIGVSARQRATR